MVSFLTKGSYPPAKHRYKSNLLPACPLQPLSCRCWFSWSKLPVLLAPVHWSEPLWQSSCVLGFGDSEKESLGWLCVSEGSGREERSTTNAALHLWNWLTQPCADQNIVSSVKKMWLGLWSKSVNYKNWFEDCAGKSWENILPGNHACAVTSWLWFGQRGQESQHE